MKRNHQPRGRVGAVWNRIANRFIDPLVKSYADLRLGSYSQVRIHRAMQDLMFPPALSAAEKIMVITTPERDEISGGVMSLFSIVGQMRQLKRFHGYEIILMTVPSFDGTTYFRNPHFINSENVYRFEQITCCQSAKEVYLHIPEYAFAHFFRVLSDEERAYLATREKLNVNIMNQNIAMMPHREVIDGYRDLIRGDISQSVGHHAYFNEEITDALGLPTLLLPAYTELDAFSAAEFGEKEKLIIYSPDEAPYKQRVLDRIAKDLPNFELKEIRGISFEAYMDLATRCMFSISFGEGFDGYLAQPTLQGGIGFAIYNSDFFPSAHFLHFDNIFEDSEDMLNNICSTISRLSSDEQSYKKLNRGLVEELRNLYSREHYVSQLKKLALRQFELLPRQAT